MALVAWSYIGWRLNRIARALERTLETDESIQLREGGIPGERRLARAFNAASGAFLQVEARATHDRLTGIPNRETLLAMLGAEVERAARHYKPLSVAFIDIDRFKPINDTYGHNSGDAVLRQIASLIADGVRVSDTFGRYGGEEFMLILPETLPEDAVRLAEELRVLVQNETLRIADDQKVHGDHQHRHRRRPRCGASARHAGRSGRRGHVRRQGARPQPHLPVPRAGRGSTGATRADLGRARAQATAIGQWASDTATQALASVLAPQPHHRGRPSDMIAALATGIGLEMGLPHEEIERIRIASLLHDLGKIAIPEEILDKPTTLSEDEWQAIGEHPRIGQVILESASNLREAIPVVLHHHERFNGGGYPHGLKGNEIPLGARIVSVADAYHAMVHDRPYSAALTHEEALDELRRNAGTQFDPEVVDVFCNVYDAVVPPDGLEEVYRLHERARGGLSQLPVAMTTTRHRGRIHAPAPGGVRAGRARRPADATDVLIVLAIAAVLSGAPSSASAAGSGGIRALSTHPFAAPASDPASPPAAPFVEPLEIAIGIGGIAAMALFAWFVGLAGRRRRVQPSASRAGTTRPPAPPRPSSS